MRKSLQGIPGARKDDYPALPGELKEFNYFVPDAGRCIAAIPEPELERAKRNGDLDMFEAMLPVRYVLDTGWRIEDGHVVVDVEYSSLIGAVVPPEYYEWNEPAKPELVAIEVGKPFPGSLPAYEGCVFDMTDGGAEIRMYYDSPTEKEVEDVTRGEKHVALTVYRGLIFFLIKFGSGKWCDMPYSAHLSPRLTVLQRPAEGQGYGAQVIMVDRKTGITRALVLLGLPNRLSNALHDAIAEQRCGRHVTKAEHDAATMDIYRSHTTEALLRMALVAQRV